MCSWNLHGCGIDAEDDVRPWLFSSGKPADIYIIGIQDLFVFVFLAMQDPPMSCQELVELGPMSVLMNTDGDEERQSQLELRVQAGDEKTRRWACPCTPKSCLRGRLPSRPLDFAT